MFADSTFSIGSSIATVVGAIVVSTQLILLKRQESEENFSKFNERYDRVIAGIPLEILIDGKSLNEVVSGSLSEFEMRLSIERAIFDYFQLCEEQVNLFVSKRGFRKIYMSEIDIKDAQKSWMRLGSSWASGFSEWSAGMKCNLAIPALRSAYEEFRDRAKDSGVSIPFSTFNEHFVSSVVKER